MEKYSRVKKNSEIYDKLSVGDDQEEMIDNSMKDYSRRTTEVDSPESLYQANRRKISEPVDDEPFAKPTEEIIKDKDLLSEFIEEVKEYNIQRGLRKVNDTQVNILKNLGKIDGDNQPVAQDEELTLDDLQSPSLVSTLRQDDEVDYDTETIAKIDPNDEELLSEDIASIMNALPDEPYGSKEYIEKTQELNIITDEELPLVDYEVVEDFEDALSEADDEVVVDESKIAQSISDLNLSSEEDILVDTSQYDTDDFYESITEEIETQHEKDDDSDSKHQIKLKKEREDELLELTQTLSLQLNDYEDELDTMHDKVSSLDKVLSVFVFILILILISIIGVVIYWIVSKKGII